jgi:hypothetical protein
MKKNDIGRACSMYEEEERCLESLGGKPNKRRPLGRSKANVRIILKWIFEK